MELTSEQYQDIEDLAGINYSIEKIAMYLNVDPEVFEKEFNLPDSQIHYHYERGKLIAEAKIDKATLSRAMDGNQVAIQQWKKDSSHERILNYKRKLEFDQQKKDYGQLQEYVEKGETKHLPPQLAKYFEQIDYIRCLFNKFNSKSYIINAVALKWPDISKFVATRLYNESINFFNLDTEVKIQAWANAYADRMDNMALLAREMGDFETARRCFKDASELRGVGREIPNEIPEELLDRRPVFYVINIKQLGLPEVSRNDLAEMIDGFNITSAQRKKLRADAGIDAPQLFLDEHAPEEDNT